MTLLIRGKKKEGHCDAFRERDDANQKWSGGVVFVLSREEEEGQISL